jgi:hypothetical protein
VFAGALAGCCHRYPDLIPVLQLCEVADTRKLITEARGCKAYGNNLELVAEGIGCAFSYYDATTQQQQQQQQQQR